MPLRIALVEPPPSDGWHGSIGLFTKASRSLSALGHDVQVIETATLARSAEGPPVLTALNRAVAARPMVESRQLACLLAKKVPDLMIAPLQGGLAQATLMARTCGEAFLDMRVALWGNQPNRASYLAGDVPEADLSPVIVDALERQCLAFADAYIRPGLTTPLPTFPGLTLHIPVVDCSCAFPPAASRKPSEQIREIVFVGAFQRSAGVGEFVEAIERLSRDGILGDQLVTFVGPVRDFAYGIGKEWLGQKAMAWPFRFRIVDEPHREAALRYAGEAGRLAVAISPNGDDLQALRAATTTHVAVAAHPMRDPLLAMQLAIRIAAAIQDPGGDDVVDEQIDWGTLVADLTPARDPRPPPAMGSVTVCILHHNRLGYLRQALDSIPPRIGDQAVEAVVIDNASPIADIEQRIRTVAGDRLPLRVLKLSEPLPQPAAYNRGLAEARSDIVVFLDDDNLFVAGGLERLVRAASAGALDIVTTALDVFDGDDPSGPSAGHLIFLGGAHSSGLFFNAFGDTAMAVRREAFKACGGFHELGYIYPCFDWVSLAKAQTAGLRIGALQWPAVRYRRDTARADLEAKKLDLAGARTFVFKAYGGSFDGALLGRLAQKLQLGEL